MVVNPKYIYLDWHSFACARDPWREYHSVLQRTIEKYKKKGFYFPYSEGHIRDIFSKSGFEENEFTEKDFAAITKISDNFYLGSANEDENIFMLKKISPYETLEWFKKNDPKPSDYIFDFFTTRHDYNSLRNPFIIDYKEISSNLRENGYIQASDCVKHLSSSSTDELKMYFREIVQYLFNMQHSGTITENHFIANGFRFLDFTSLFREKLTKKNLPMNIANDGTHALWSKNAIYFITEDKDFVEKYNFMQGVSDLHAKILTLQDFCSPFYGQPSSIITL